MIDLASTAVSRVDRIALASTGAGDIGLFGLPPIAFAVGPPGAVTAADDGVGAAQGAAPAATLHTLASRPFSLDVPLIAISDAAPTPAPPALLSVPVPVPPVPDAAAPVATGSSAVIAPIDASAAVPAMTIASQPPPVTGDIAQPAAAAPAAIEQAIETVRVSADQLNTALATLAAQVTSAAPVASAGTVLADIETSAASLVAQADRIVADSVATVSALTDTTAEQAAEASTMARDLISSATADAAGIAESTTAAAAGLVDTALTDADNLVTAAIAATGTVTDNAASLVTDGVSAATSAASELVDTVRADADTPIDASIASVEALTTSATGRVTEVVDAVPIPAAADLIGEVLGGSDPAGGFATLTALLREDASFELFDPEGGAVVFAPVAAATEVVAADLDALGDDGVVSDIAEAPLLGAAEAVGGLLGGLGLQQEDDGHG